MSVAQWEAMQRLLLVLLATSCADQRLVASGEVALEGPDRLSFPPTAISFSRHRPVRLTNRSALAHRVTPVIDGPFSGPAEVALEPAGEVEVLVTFTPSAAGAQTGHFRVGELVISVDGEGVLPLACAEPRGCRSHRFDAESLSCLEVIAPDGAACADACVEAGQCHEGECRGRERSCDDANPCTSDACAPERGCVHEVVACEAPANPCLAARCEAPLGCQTSPVVDGTPCGASSCEQAQICLAGQCRAVVPPDGFVCAPATPCQSEGRCRDRRCERPAPRALEPNWSVTAVTPDFRFRGLSDADGNRYWVECFGSSSPTCVASSRSASGQPRFSTTLSVAPARGETSSGDQVLRSGFFVFGTNASEVAAVEMGSGALRWQRRLGQTPGRLLALAADDRFLWALVQRDDESRSWTVSRLALVSGQEQVVFTTTDGPLEGLVLGGAVAFGSRSGRNPAVLQLRPDGSVVTMAGGSGPVAMVAGDLLVLSDDAVLSAATGALLEAPLSAVFDATGWPGVARDGVRHRLMRPGIDRHVPFIDQPGSEVVLQRVEAGRRVTLLETADVMATSPWLTEQGDVLFVGMGERTVARLVDGRDGGVRFECPLELGGRQLSVAQSAWSGRELTLQAWEVVDACPACRPDPRRLWSPAVLLTWDLGPTAPAPASRGWMGPSGGPGGGQRAR